MITLYLVRHAQSRQQVERSDDWDSSLTPRGHAQAARLSRWLAGGLTRGVEPGEIAALYTSPLARARETAAYAEDALRLPPISLDELCEARFHVSSHLPRAEDPTLRDLTARPSEVYGDFQRRTDAALKALIEAAAIAGKPILAVTHGGVIKTILRSLAGGYGLTFALHNTGVTLVAWRSGRWVLMHLDSLDHLPPELWSR